MNYSALTGEKPLSNQEEFRLLVMMHETILAAKKELFTFGEQQSKKESEVAVGIYRAPEKLEYNHASRKNLKIKLEDTHVSILRE